MHYKFKFYGIGNPIKGDNYKVYLRYYIKTKVLNIPTQTILSKDQIKMVNASDFGGIIQSELEAMKATAIQAVETLNLKNNGYPSPEQLKEFFLSIQNSLPMEGYINEYLKSVEVKSSSKKLYAHHLKYFNEYYKQELKNRHIAQLLNKETIEDFGNWLKRRNQAVPILKKKELKTIGDVQIFNLKSTAFRLLNFIADKLHRNPIPAYLQQPAFSEKYTPSEEQFKKLVATSVRYADHLQKVQDQVYVNSFLGLRVEELLNIKKDNITLNKQYLSIRFVEYKKSISRDVILVDAKAIYMVKRYLVEDDETDYLWKGNRSAFNRNLKTLASKSFKDKTVFLYSTSKQDEEKYIIKDIISSHCIRRFAITRNIERYGIDVARTFSGHQNYETVVKHYSKGFLSKKIALEKLLQGK